jgi:hypothetical protein
MQWACRNERLTCRARQLFQYMKSYNYEVKSTGEVITFAGNYRSSRGQAAAITFYMLLGMLSCGLVFSIALPGGNWWYLLTLLTPIAPIYYFKNADRCGPTCLLCSAGTSTEQCNSSSFQATCKRAMCFNNFMLCAQHLNSY